MLHPFVWAFVVEAVVSNCAVESAVPSGVSGVDALGQRTLQHLYIEHARSSARSAQGLLAEMPNPPVPVIRENG